MVGFSYCVAYRQPRRRILVSAILILLLAVALLLLPNASSFCISCGGVHRTFSPLQQRPTATSRTEANRLLIAGALPDSSAAETESLSSSVSTTTPDAKVTEDAEGEEDKGNSEPITAVAAADSPTTNNDVAVMKKKPKKFKRKPVKLKYMPNRISRSGSGWLFLVSYPALIAIFLFYDVLTKFVLPEGPLPTWTQIYDYLNQ